MSTALNQISLYLKHIMRDRLLYGVMFVAFFMILLVPVFSNFSIRQVQELAITLSLSSISFILLMVSLLLGSSSVWRDIERRYTASILTLPISRSSYILAKFFAIALFIVISAVVLALASAVVIKLSALSFPSDISIHWRTIFLAILGDMLKYILLAAFALLFSSLSTSFFLPFFGTAAIYFVGNSSQEVFEYISGPYGQKLSNLSVAAIKAVYYLLPNFAGFNFKVHAVYGLPVPITGLSYAALYFAVYTAILLYAAVWIFARRELP